MKFLLDTNIYFAVIHERGFLDRHRELLRRIGPLTYLSSVVRFELLQGAVGDLGRARVKIATRRLERTGRVHAPTDADWMLAGTIQGKIWDGDPSLRTKSFQNDILIACSARRIGAILITENRRYFDLIRRYLRHAALSIETLARLLG